MKLTAEFNQVDHQISVEREGDRVIASIDERKYELNIREVSQGVYLLINDGHVYECRIEKPATANGTFIIHLKNQAFSLKVADPRKLQTAGRSAMKSVGGAEEIVSPMAGKIIRVLVELGAQVNTGDGIVVVEAMKMQNELKSSRDGIVTEIHAVPGATTNAGEVLAIIEGMADKR